MYVRRALASQTQASGLLYSELIRDLPAPLKQLQELTDEALHLQKAVLEQLLREPHIELTNVDPKRLEREVQAVSSWCEFRRLQPLRFRLTCTDRSGQAVPIFADDAGSCLAALIE